ncbi:hypothetical protein N431DRAFT_550594 [Stipitochalara longipes BDJ]|nr:hypothetical protein N431DRAFT_550594 [Stipitochalara longipes BDJ]
MTDRVRRNGQLSSCEPCRHSKLRCDHNRPICGRCVRRGLPQSRCHYHPAPMAMARQSTPQSVQDISHQQQLSSLMCFNDPNAPHMQRTYTSLTRTGVAAYQAPLPSRHKISEGTSLLNEILELATEVGEPLESSSVLDPNSCFHGPLIEVAWKETNNKIRTLIHDCSITDMESISQAIFARTSSAPLFPPTAAAVFLGGERDKSPGSAAHHTLKSDRKALMQRAFRACIQCESYCDYLGAINDFTLTFLLLTILLATWCFGDDSYHVLRLEGSMTSVFFALGFHRGVQSDSSVPFYMVKIRRRAIAWAHDYDKACASFMSRPARLSRSFCVIELPLELSDSIIMGTTESFLRARESLDDHGWSKDMDILPVSRLRAQLMLSVIREEALELKIGPAVPGLEAKAVFVLQKLKSTWQSLPAHLKYDTAQHWEVEASPTMILQGLRLEYLYTEFLLHTLLGPFSRMYRESLIITAHEVVNLVLLPTRKRALLYSHRADMEWTLVFYAVPCSSVLILELLRENQHPEERLPINRSGIIQDISGLISCCDSLTESGQSNYQICKQAQSIFSRSLDSILNQDEPTQKNKSGQLTMHLHEHSDQDHHGRADSTSAEAPNAVVQDHEWMSWLDSVGLQGDSCLESLFPTLDLPIDETI